MRRTALWGVFSLLLALSFNRVGAGQPSSESGVAESGTIVGSVRLGGACPKLESLAITKDADYCGRMKSCSRLVVGKGNGIEDAVVMLKGVTAGKAVGAGPTVTLDQFRCEYRPHVLVLPPNGKLEIRNSDPILHNVHAYAYDQSDLSLFNIAQPIRGQCTPVLSTKLPHEGTVLTTCDAGHPWMGAYIIPAANPYYALTDKEGKFRIQNVPPGTYTITMWHEGVTIVGKEMENGTVKKYTYEKPYEDSRQVVVPARGEVSVNFELALRESAAH